MNLVYVCITDLASFQVNFEAVQNQKLESYFTNGNINFVNGEDTGSKMPPSIKAIYLTLYGVGTLLFWKDNGYSNSPMHILIYQCIF